MDLQEMEVEEQLLDILDRMRSDDPETRPDIKEGKSIAVQTALVL